MADLKTKLTNMKVAELRTELGNLGLEKQGTKMVLVERLLKHYQASEDGNPVAENGENAEADQDVGDEGAEDETVVVDEVLDTTNEDHVVNVEEEEVQYEDEEELNENGVEDVDEIYAEDETEEGHDDAMGEEEQVEADDADDADAETQVVVADDEDNGDALNISVEESEVLGIEHDGKTGEDEETNDTTEDGDGAKTEPETTTTSDQDDGNNTSTSGKNEADSDNKPVEGESSEVSEETTRESERHIILVTGLSADTSANDLKTFFRKHGKIGRIKIMTNTRVPGSQRFAHISVPSLDELNYLVDTLNGVQLKGKSIRVAKAPEDGSVSRSYEIAVATAKAEADGGEFREEKGKESNESASGSGEGGKDSNDVQVTKDGSPGKDATKRDGDSAKKTDAERKKEERKDVLTEKKTPEKNSRPDRPTGHRSRRESHDRPRGDHLRNQRPFRRDKDSTEWKRHGPPRGPMEVTRVHRDRPPMGRAPPPMTGGRRRSPHAPTLTFEQIREIRDEQRRREHERRKREEERERAAEVERQKRLEYQNYMEFKQLEREREKLRLERERVEREKQELIKLERERQKAERERIEREKEEIRRAKLNIEHPRSSVGVKRPYEDDKVRRRDSAERKKPFVVERGRSDAKTEAERKIERERFARDRLHAGHSSEGRGRSPFRASASGGTGTRESRRDVWARDERDRPGRVRTRSDERGHRRETEAEKVAAAERRAREITSRATGSSSDLLSRHQIDSSHSSSRSADATKRPSDRYDDARAVTSSSRESEWIQRSYLNPASSLSLPLSTSASTGRESWPFGERKIEAWDNSRLTPRTEQWISGAGATVGTTGRSSLPVIAPPPPLYSSAAASLALQSSGLSLGGYTGADRYDGYRSGFHPIRKY